MDTSARWDSHVPWILFLSEQRHEKLGLVGLPAGLGQSAWYWAYHRVPPNPQKEIAVLTRKSHPLPLPATKAVGFRVASFIVHHCVRHELC